MEAAGKGRCSDVMESPFGWPASPPRSFLLSVFTCVYCGYTLPPTASFWLKRRPVTG